MIPQAIVAKIGIAAILVSVSFGIGVRMGYKYEHSSSLEREAERSEAEKQTLLKHQQELDVAIHKERAAIAQAEREGRDAIKKLKQDYAATTDRRLSIIASCSGSTSGSTITPGVAGPDAGITGTVELPQAVGEDLYREAKRADTLVEQFRILQHWLIYQGLYAND